MTLYSLSTSLDVLAQDVKRQFVLMAAVDSDKVSIFDELKK